MGKYTDMPETGSVNLTFVGSPICKIMERVILKLCSTVSVEQMPLKFVFSSDAYKSVPPKRIHNVHIRRYFNRVYGALAGLGAQLKEDDVIIGFEVDADGDSIVRMRMQRSDSTEINFGIVVGPYDDEKNIIYLKKFGKDMLDFSVENMVAERISSVYSDNRIKYPERLSEFYAVTNFFDIDIESLSRNGMVGYVMHYRTVPLSQNDIDNYEYHYENDINCSYPFANAIRRADKFVKFAKDDNKNIWLCTEEVFKRKDESELAVGNSLLGAASIMCGDEQSDKNKCITGLDNHSTNSAIIEHAIVQVCAYGSSGMTANKGRYMLMQSTLEYEQMHNNERELTINMRDYFNGITAPLSEVGTNLMKDGAVHSYTVGMESLMEVSIKMKRDEYGKEFGMYVGCYDSEVGMIFINAYGHGLDTFSVERVLAERIAMIYADNRLTCPECLRDFYMITNCFNVDIGKLRYQLKSNYDVDLSQKLIGTDAMQDYAEAYRKATEHYNENGQIFASAMKRVHDFVAYIRQDGEFEWECILKEFSHM